MYTPTNQRTAIASNTNALDKSVNMMRQLVYTPTNKRTTIASNTNALDKSVNIFGYS